jgi:hypothetical protein
LKFLSAHIAQSFSGSRKWICCLVLLRLAVMQSLGQNTAQEYQVKAVFLYNFTQFIDWPQTAFKNAEDPFVIGIMGNDPFGPYLEETVEGEKIGTHPIIVKHCRDIRSAAGCHMLYINSNDREWVRNILSALEEKNILTVSDAPFFTDMGGIIRFYTEDNKIRLQINISRSKSAQLNISSKLLSVAKTN